jgi:hypothetical protein
MVCRRHRRTHTHTRSSACADVDDLLDALRDNLWKADAFITTAEGLIERPRSIGGDDCRYWQF